MASRPWIHINYQYFTQKWLKRAERDKVYVDEGDKFISLWIAFNGWMKGKFGEERHDRYLITKVKNFEDIKRVFEDLKSNNTHFAENLAKLGEYSVADMRAINVTERTKRYDSTYESLIEVIYQIRCNLFHGRKDTRDNEKDFELICLAYNILLPLFKEYLGRYGYS